MLTNLINDVLNDSSFKFKTDVKWNKVEHRLCMLRTELTKYTIPDDRFDSFAPVYSSILNGNKKVRGIELFGEDKKYSIRMECAVNDDSTLVKVYGQKFDKSVYIDNILALDNIAEQYGCNFDYRKDNSKSIYLQSYKPINFVSEPTIKILDELLKVQKASEECNSYIKKAR